MEWWVQVIVIPEEIKIIVFIRGISKRLKGLIPKGGHSCPISIEGASEWVNSLLNTKVCLIYILNVIFTYK